MDVLCVLARVGVVAAALGPACASRARALGCGQAAPGPPCSDGEDSCETKPICGGVSSWKWQVARERSAATAGGSLPALGPEAGVPNKPNLTSGDGDPNHNSSHLGGAPKCRASHLGTPAQARPTWLVPNEANWPWSRRRSSPLPREGRRSRAQDAQPTRSRLQGGTPNGADGQGQSCETKPISGLTGWRPKTCRAKQSQFARGPTDG